VSPSGTFRSYSLTRAYSRFIGAGLAFGGTYAAWRWLTEEIEVEIQAEEAEREAKRQAKRIRWRKVGEDGEIEGPDDDDEEEDDEEDEETGIIFFPTGLSRPKKKELYRGSDPEWQEFIRIAPDRKRTDRIRGELIAIVRALAAKNPSYVLRLGKINPNTGSIWIEIKFPDGPPPEYERPGWELTDEGNLRATTRPVDEVHHRRLTNVLAPTATATSIYLDMKRRADSSWRGFKQYMGWKETAKPPTVQTILTLPGPPSAPKSPASTTASTTSTPPPTSAAGESETKDGSASSKGITERFGASLPDPTVVPTMDLAYFRAMFRRNNKPKMPSPPRGSFLVHGLVEVVGDRARMTLDVAASYDPKVGRYVQLVAKVRSITDYKQTPKGGP
jgi:hypothetical protein